MSPEFGMASAMFTESLKLAGLFLGCTVGGIVTGFVLDRYFGKSRSIRGNAASARCPWFVLWLCLSR